MNDPTTAIVREKLEEITRGAGRFSRDPLTHASNTIEDMRELAREALALMESEQGEQMRLVFDVDFPGDPDAGLHSFTERVTVIVDSGDPGGDPGEFQDAAKSFLLEWFDGATILGTESENGENDAEHENE